MTELELNDFLKDYDIDYSKYPIDVWDVAGYEESLGVSFGAQLRNYLTTYGYIGYKHIELLGINSIQKENSDMIRTTLRLRKSSAALENLVAIENQGDGDYYLTDKNDKMYRFLSVSKELLKLPLDLNGYIANRIANT